MLALRLVIDTNVLVSAALKPDGLQRTTLLVAITKPARLYVSKAILEEYADVLSRPELSIRRGLRLQLLQMIRNHGHLVTPGRRIEATSDPDDNIFVECADAARADFLITGIASTSQCSGRTRRSSRRASLWIWLRHILSVDPVHLLTHTIAKR